MDAQRQGLIFMTIFEKHMAMEIITPFRPVKNMPDFEISIAPFYGSKIKILNVKLFLRVVHIVFFTMITLKDFKRWRSTHMHSSKIVNMNHLQCKVV